MLNYSGVLIYAFGRCFNPNAFTYEYCKKNHAILGTVIWSYRILESVV